MPMSDPISHDSTEPSDNRTLLSALAWVGVILLFVLIVRIAYLPTRPQPLDQALIEQRIKTLADVKAKQAKLISTYEVVDAQNKVVRIPVERAMELTVQRLNAKSASGLSAAQSVEPLAASTTTAE